LSFRVLLLLIPPEGLDPVAVGGLFLMFLVSLFSFVALPEETALFPPLPMTLLLSILPSYCYDLISYFLRPGLGRCFGYGLTSC